MAIVDAPPTKPCGDERTIDPSTTKGIKMKEPAHDRFGRACADGSSAPSAPAVPRGEFRLLRDASSG
jgi:hypothetical protein